IRSNTHVAGDPLAELFFNQLLHQLGKLPGIGVESTAVGEVQKGFVQGKNLHVRNQRLKQLPQTYRHSPRKVKLCWDKENLWTDLLGFANRTRGGHTPSLGFFRNGNENRSTVTLYHTHRFAPQKWILL